MGPRILILDIETRPYLAYVWSLWKQNIALNQIEEDWEIMTYAAKWLDDDVVYYDTSQDSDTDEKCLESLWELLDQADWVIAHNGDRFDLPKINARFLKHKIKPPSPYKRIDTLKIAKANFRLTSNRLDYIAKFLGYPGKLNTGGMQLWIRCMKGDKKAWDDMLEYNIQDVAILEWVYKELRPWMTNHPNYGVYTDDETTCCPTCGSTKIQYRGYAYTTAGKFRRFVCRGCGHWSRHATNELPIGKRKGLARNVSR